jgi:hypothetical protein
MLAHPRERGTDGDARNDFEFHKIDDGDVAVRSGHIGGEMQIRTKERGPMLAEKQDQSADRQHHEEEVDAKVSGTVHASLGIVTRDAE